MGSAKRASSGPALAVMSTYAATNAWKVGGSTRLTATIPAMTTLNSPRAESSAPARSAPMVVLRTLCAAIQPVMNFVAMVTTASRKAGRSTAGRSPGSTTRPKYAKNTAASTSRSGSRRRRATSATSPVRSRPTRKAATAGEKSTSPAKPAAAIAAPKTMRSRPTGSRGLSSRCQRTDPLSAMTTTMATTRSAVPTVMSPDTRLAPVSTTDRIGR